MRSPRPLLLSLSLLVACALSLPACGGDEEGTIPPENAAVLVQSLDDARGERDNENCQGIADAAGNLLTAVEELPETVDPEVRTGLSGGAENLQDLADDPEKCESAGTTGPSGQQDEDEADTTTTPTTTDTTTDTTTTTTEEDEEPPPQPENEGGGGLGQGNQGGQPGGPNGGGPNGGGPPQTPPGQAEPPTGGTEGDD